MESFGMDGFRRFYESLAMLKVQGRVGAGRGSISTTFKAAAFLTLARPLPRAVAAVPSECMQFTGLCAV